MIKSTGVALNLIAESIEACQSTQSQEQSLGKRTVYQEGNQEGK